MPSAKELKALLSKNYIVVPLERLVPAAWNFKMDDKAKAQKLLASVEKNGQIKNCNVREVGDGNYEVVGHEAKGSGHYEIIDGNHRLPVYQELGYTHAICYNHGPISEAEAIELAHSMLEYFEIDPILQAEALATLAESEGPVSLASVSEVSPYTLSELVNLQDLDAVDWQKELEQNAPAKDEGDEDDLVVLHFTFAGEAQRDLVNAGLERIMVLRGLSHLSLIHI